MQFLPYYCIISSIHCDISYRQYWRMFLQTYYISKKLEIESCGFIKSIL